MPNEVVTATKSMFDLGKQLEELATKVDSMLVPISTRAQPIPIRTWDELETFAEKAANSGMVPKDFIGKKDAIIIAVQMGSELGLSPMQSLINIAVVNGRPSVWGDALPGLVRASGVCAYIKEWQSGEGDNLTFHCEARRKDDPNVVRSSFSVADAKQAGLWQTEAFVRRKSRDGSGWYDAPNDSPWFRYRPRMLKMRARGFCLRDGFSDVLKGLISAEEAGDMVDDFKGVTISGQAIPVVQQQLASGQAQPAQTEPAGQQETKAEGQATTGQAPAAEQKRRMTTGEWLSQLNLELTMCKTVAEVEAIFARDQVIRARTGGLTNGALDRFNEMCNSALGRVMNAARSQAAAGAQGAAQDRQMDDVAKDLAEAEKNFTTQGQPEDGPKPEDKPKIYERRPTTPTEWINALDAQLAIATPDEVRLILQREDVLQAQENMAGPDRVKLFEVTEKAAIKAGIEPDWAKEGEDQDNGGLKEDAVAKAAEDAIRRAEEEKAEALKAADDTWPGPR